MELSNINKTRDLQFQEKAKQLVNELNELTKGDIFPRTENMYYAGFLKLIKKPLDESELIIYNKLKEFVNHIIKDESGANDFYSVIEKYGFDQWEEYKKRQKLHYLYNCEIGVDNASGEEHRFKLYEMSAFKVQVESGMYPDERYYKDLPDWMIDIKSFTDLIIPYDCSTVFLFNPDKKAVVDLRKQELFLLP